jgi:hypothetical protein
MNIFKKWDRIPRPYSTILALVEVSLLGLFLIIWKDETRLLGFGIVAGGFLFIIFKAAAEVSDRETWQRIRRFFGRRRRNS